MGEPPATRGYPPSVFARIPDLVERAGNSEVGRGSITAFYTVLAEGDDLQDPVADAARAILDGHVVLSRALAEEGQYPAVDVEASISRAMPAITTPSHRQVAQEFKKLHARFQQNRDLISVGAYAAGSDEDTDRAVARMPAMRRYLQQALDEQVAFDASVAQLLLLSEQRPVQALEQPGEAPRGLLQVLASRCQAFGVARLVALLLAACVAVLVTLAVPFLRGMTHDSLELCRAHPARIAAGPDVLLELALEGLPAHDLGRCRSGVDTPSAGALGLEHHALGDRGQGPRRIGSAAAGRNASLLAHRHASRRTTVISSPRRWPRA